MLTQVVCVSIDEVHVSTYTQKIIHNTKISH